MENWNTEKKMTVLGEVRDALCDAFDDARTRRTALHQSYAAQQDAIQNIASLANALVKVLDKIDDFEKKQNPGQGARVIQRKSANNR